jgi:hypothetical protein
MLKDYPGAINTVIEYAWSAAVLPALAGERRAILAGGSLFFHRTWQTAVGTGADLEKAAKRLHTIDLMDARIYAEASGQTVEDMLALMDESAVLNSCQALENGFVHEIIDEPGGEIIPPEIWHETARGVVAHGLATLADQTPEAVQARGAAIYAAGQIEDYPLPTAPPGGWPLTTAAESAELRRRHQDQLSRLDRRLAGFAYGGGPDPRRVPIEAAWTCAECGAVNFSPPRGQDGRINLCINCQRR